jgi:prepilin-type N-terminal cleavage/methylation domain-containing protein
MKYPCRDRHGFTIAEMTLALAILTIALTMVAEVSVQALRERERVSLRQAAQEEAANVLEAARTCPWDQLNARWAETQELPPGVRERGWKLKVQVEAEPSRPGIKRVTVDIEAANVENQRLPIKLVGLFADRSREAKP